MLLLALLGALTATAGLSATGWAVGTLAAVALGVLLRRAAGGGGHLRPGRVLGPADRVTLVRAVLTGGLAGLVAESFTRDVPRGALVALVVVALSTDWLDGQVARRTGTVSGFGARFDMEVDSALLLVLSVHVAGVLGPWVLVIGAARYAFVAAGWVLPWLRGVLPPRYWRKVAAAVQGIALATATSDVLERDVTVLVLLAAVALLVESFGRDVLGLWRRRPRAGSAPGRRSVARAGGVR